MSDTGLVKSEDTPFEGGPMDGRTLPVLLGPTGHPPKTYRIPVPAPDGSAPTVLVYRRVPRTQGRGLGLARWTYAYDPEGAPRRRLRWPWSRPDTTGTPGTAPDAPDVPGTSAGGGADNAPGGKPDDADG